MIRGTDLAIWRRIMLIPFGETIPDEEKDPHLLDKLKYELPGILAWCVEGSRRWFASGLNAPATVKAAVESYRAEQDLIGQFIADCCTVGSGKSVNATRLYQAYVKWSENGGNKPDTQTEFGRRLTDLGHTSDRVKQQTIRYGLDIVGESLAV